MREKERPAGIKNSPTCEGQQINPEGVTEYRQGWSAKHETPARKVRCDLNPEGVTEGDIEGFCHPFGVLFAYETISRGFVLRTPPLPIFCHPFGVLPLPITRHAASLHVRVKKNMTNKKSGVSSQTLPILNEKILLT